MAPSSNARHESASDRSLRLVSFSGLVAAIVGSAVALSLSLGVYAPSATAAELTVGDGASPFRTTLTTPLTGDTLSALHADGLRLYPE